MKDDVVVRKAWQLVVTDIIATGSYPSTFSSRRLEALRNALSVGAVRHGRNQCTEAYQHLPSAPAKELYQAVAFGKRWIFSDDESQDTLKQRSLLDFIDTQEKLPKELGVLHERVERVLQTAKELCEDVLGSYTVEEHKALCRFGKKAAFNLKAEDAYLHNRIPQMSVTRRQMVEFGEWLMEDHQLRACLLSQTCGKMAITSYLNLTIVPKSYKSGRAIVPDTILGGYISAGFGEMIRRRLKVNAGLNIRRKQAEHRRVACKASVTGHLATVDMSKASDRITWPLLQRILPPDWLRVIEIDRIHQVLVKDEDLGFAYPKGVRTPENDATLIRVNSPLLMGKGYTFPLQTLVFYILLKSIAKNLGMESKYISVYGDDLIYPCAMHRYVASVFHDVGLKLNLDKSYADPRRGTLYREDGAFRESCGGDYISGMDVRPYMPEGRSGEQSYRRPADYAALCYTLINGLLSRWNWYELRMTLRFLLIEAQNCFGKIFVVPASAAVSSGLRWCEDIDIWLPIIDEHFVVDWPKFRRVEHRGGGYTDDAEYNSLGAEAEYAEVPPDECIYMWDSLRQEAAREVDEDLPAHIIRGIPGLLGELIAVNCKSWETEYEVEVLYRRKLKIWITKTGETFSERPQDVPARPMTVEIPSVRVKGKKTSLYKEDRHRLPGWQFQLVNPA